MKQLVQATTETESDIEELYKEVQKELHTRFKNMFEGDMLLPNLDFNPNFEGKVEDKPEINRKDEPVEEDE